MVGIIVAFPNKDNATNIRNLLVRGGVDVLGVCTSGTQAISYADTVDEGIVVCGYKLRDVMYTDLRMDLPDSFRLLLVASPEKWMDGLPEGVEALAMPIKAFALVEKVREMEDQIYMARRRRRLKAKKRNAAQDEKVRQAKALLMEHNQMTEDEAHKYLQKTSMDSGRSMVESAEMILRIMKE